MSSPRGDIFPDYDRLLPRLRAARDSVGVREIFGIYPGWDWNHVKDCVDAVEKLERAEFYSVVKNPNPRKYSKTEFEWLVLGVRSE